MVIGVDRKELSFLVFLQFTELDRKETTVNVPVDM